MFVLLFDSVVLCSVGCILSQRLCWDKVLFTLWTSVVYISQNAL